MKKVTRYQNGFVLILVLLFLNLIAVFALSSLESYLITQKISTDSLDAFKNYNQATRQFANIEKNLVLVIPFCQITSEEANNLVKQSIQWWQRKACKDFKTYYVIENLGDDPCAIIDNTTHAAYYRITLRLSENEARQNPVFQSTISIKTKSFIPCELSYHKVKLGRQNIIQLQ